MAFEPSPKNAKLLRQNLADNGLHNVEVVQAAVADHPGTLKFRHTEGFGAGSQVVTVDHPAATAGHIDVPVVTLDKIIQPTSRSVQFLKLDVEGFEPQVLAGAAELLRRDRPLIYMEFNTWTLLLHGTQPVAYAQALWKLFEISNLKSDGTHEPASEPIMSFLHTNIIEHGCIDDLLMRLKPGEAVPSAAHLTQTQSTLQQMASLERELAEARAHSTLAQGLSQQQAASERELAEMRAQLAAMRASNSWRVSAPFRIAADLARRLIARR